MLLTIKQSSENDLSKVTIINNDNYEMVISRLVAIDTFQHLEKIDIRECINITGDDLAKLIAKAPNLKKINIYLCKRLTHLPDIGTLQHLEELVVGDIKLTGDDLVKLIAKAPNLKKINIYMCFSFTHLTGSLGTLQHLEELTIVWINITGDDLAKFIANAPNIKKINIHLCYRLAHLPNSFGTLQHLEELTIDNTHLTGDDFAKLVANAPNLKKIRAFACYFLNNLPDNLGFLQHLEDLCVGYCTTLTGDDLAKILVKAPNLKIISADDCLGLVCLPDDLAALEHLEEIYVRNTKLACYDLAKIIAKAPLLIKSCLEKFYQQADALSPKISASFKKAYAIRLSENDLDAVALDKLLQLNNDSFETQLQIIAVQYSTDVVIKYLEYNKIQYKKMHEALLELKLLVITAQGALSSDIIKDKVLSFFIYPMAGIAPKDDVDLIYPANSRHSYSNLYYIIGNLPSMQCHDIIYGRILCAINRNSHLKKHFNDNNIKRYYSEEAATVRKAFMPFYNSYVSKQKKLDTTYSMPNLNQRNQIYERAVNLNQEQIEYLTWENNLQKFSHLFKLVMQ
jgi:hypothetical protein